MERSIGLLGATGIGIGAIVGGGILALAGVAFATTGPSALIVFATNGVIAVLTALSFAEMSTAFPESGGTYTFAKKVLSVRSAFAFGWVGWFASIVAGVLYALGFGAYAAIVLQEGCVFVFGEAPSWLVGSDMVTALAVGATAFYTFGLVRKNSGGGRLDQCWKNSRFCFAHLWRGVGADQSFGWRYAGKFNPVFFWRCSGLFSGYGLYVYRLAGLRFDCSCCRRGSRAPPRFAKGHVIVAGRGIVHLFTFIICDCHGWCGTGCVDCRFECRSTGGGGGAGCEKFFG